MKRSLVVLSAALPLIALVPGTASASVSRIDQLVAAAESLYGDANGAEHSTDVVADVDNKGVARVTANGYVMGEVTCPDGSVDLEMRWFDGSGTADVSIAHNLSSAVVSATIEVTRGIYPPCGAPAPDDVVEPAAVRIQLTATGPATLTFGRWYLRQPSVDNTHAQTAETFRAAEGALQVGSLDEPTTSATISHSRWMGHGELLTPATSSLAAAPVPAPVSGVVTTRQTGRGVLANGWGGWAADDPTQPGLVAEDVAVQGETPQGGPTTVYANYHTTRLVECAGGGLGLVDTVLHAEGPGTLQIGGSYRDAVVSGTVPYTRFSYDECTGETTETPEGETEGTVTVGLQESATERATRTYMPSMPLWRWHQPGERLSVEQFKLTYRLGAGTVSFGDVSFATQEAGASSWSMRVVDKTHDLS